ncbi:Pre-mRNA-splicing factor slt11 [Savitreella phatthalungensis]
MLDLQFGLPTQVRDAALKLADEKKTAVNRQFQAQQASAGDGSALEKYGGKSESAARDLLRRLANSKPYDRTGIESHSDKKSETARSRKQSLQTADGSIEPPPDKSITSLLLLGVSDELPEHAIRSFFSTHGQLRSVVCSHRSKCAFVNFTDRNYAERAAGACPEGKLTLRGVPLRVQWAKPRLLSGFHNEKRNAAIIDAGR